MGLTKSSTGTQLLEDNFSYIKNKNGYTIALAGNPNVGKSTIFNSLTGMHQHTGNWPGKTVSNATGTCIYKKHNFLFVDIPGTYSIMSNSEEEEIARDYICFGNPDVTVIVVDSTCLEKNLNLVYQIMEITDNIIVCVNLLDEAKKKKIHIDLDKLSDELGVPVVGTIGQKKSTLNNLMDTIIKSCASSYSPKKIKYPQIIEDNIYILEKELKRLFILPSSLYRWIALKIIDGDKKIIHSIEKNFSVSIFNNEDLTNCICDIHTNLSNNGISSENFKDIIISSILKKCEHVSSIVCNFIDKNYMKKSRQIDKILTSKVFGFPIMILFLGIIFWLTIVGANYPSQILFSFFSWLQTKLLTFASFVNCPTWLSDMLILGVYQTLTWVISVMLPPMAIFFPLFTFLEDLGYLPRIAFNMDGFFKKCCCTR